MSVRSIPSHSLKFLLPVAATKTGRCCARNKKKRKLIDFVRRKAFLSLKRERVLPA